MERSTIEWTDATFNPWIGCTRVGPGCDHCYAEAMMDTRRHVVAWGAGKPRKRTSPGYWEQPLRWNQRDFYRCKSCGWRGEGKDYEPQCCDRMAWTLARRRVFCASLADVFDNDVDPAWRVDLFRLIESTPNLDWLLLTKRIGNAEKMIAGAVRALRAADAQVRPWIWPNVWLGATVVNQAEAERDIPKLLATPAHYRFLSCEPLLGAIDLTIDGLSCVDCPDCNDPDEPRFADPDTGVIECRRCDGTGKGDDIAIDWVIAGGESGHGARPMHPDWLRQLRDQCANAGVPFLFKQWGEFREFYTGPETEQIDADDDLARVLAADAVKPTWLALDGTRVSTIDEIPENLPMRLLERVGKKRAGRTLDGRTHDATPA